MTDSEACIQTYFRVGKRFKRYDLLQETIEKYTKDSRYQLRRVNGTLLSTMGNNVVGIVDDIGKQDALKYLRLSYVCELGAGKDSQATCRRSRSKKRGCPFLIKIKAEGSSLVIKKIVDHMPHPKVTFKRPKLNQEDTEKATFSLKAGAPMSKVAHLMNEKNDKILSKDVHNHLSKIIDNTEAEIYMADETKNGNLQIIKDIEDKPVAYLYQDQLMKDLWKTYGDCLLSDSTFSMVKKKWSLFAILCVNGEAYSEIVCWFLVKNETYIKLAQVFNRLKEVNDFEKIETWLTDKDMSERKIIREYAKNVNLGLCFFHVKRAFNRYLNFRKTGWSKEEKANKIGMLYRILVSKNQEEHDSLVQRLDPISKEYYLKNWEPCKHEFIEVFKPGKMHLGIRTTNRCESFFQKIKNYCKKKDILENFIMNINRYISKRRCENLYELQKIYIKRECNPKTILNREIRKTATNYAFLYMNEMYLKAKTLDGSYIDSDYNCSRCLNYEKIGMPCLHQLANIEDPGILERFIKKRWTSSVLFAVYNISWFEDCPEFNGETETIVVDEDNEDNGGIVEDYENDIGEQDNRNNEYEDFDTHKTTFSTLFELSKQLSSVILDDKLLKGGLGESLIQKLIDELEDGNTTDVLTRNNIFN
eukprot:GAHX01001168.1.p1 GENE.GAHX01001168.1~~GAHX01001168.1.p1  ORF type:complete len:645 (+),score=93.39 GAHX01001168.1:44-1978(+)